MADQWLGRQRSSLRMGKPGVESADGGGDSPGGKDALFDLLHRERSQNRSQHLRVGAVGNPHRAQERLSVPRVVRVGPDPAVGNPPEP
jgi:hypothetical protein